MKHFLYIILMCLVLLAGCSEPMNLSRDGTPAAGTGRLNLSVTGTGERTILPETPVFSKYEFTFSPLDGQQGHNNITVNAGNSADVVVDLAIGNWTVTARGYVYISGITGIPNGDLKAAEGRANISISSGQSHSLSIDLKGGVQAGEKGIFEWELTFHNEIQSANMAILTLEGEEVKAVDILNTPDGNTALDAGYYLLAISIDNQSPKAEVLHIYGGMTSRIVRYLCNAFFNNIDDMANWLNTAPVNAVNTPYEIILYGLNIQTDFYQDGYSLYKLYNALNGKYVKLDLSYCKGQSIFESSYDPDSILDKDKIVSIILPLGLTSIGGYAFSDCTSLSLIELPSGLTSIGDNAFLNCTNLALTSLPAGLTSIDYSAFEGCTSLISMAIPASLTSIGRNPFVGCTSLTSISVENGNPNYSSEGGILYNKAKTTIIAVPIGINGSVTIPVSVTSIGTSAFSGCTNLTLTSLPAGLTSIGYGAFSGCTNLALTELPAGLTSIDYYAFSGCTNLALTELPAGLTSIVNGAFSGCTNLALTELPAGLTSIGYEVFRNCTSLALTELPAGLTSIGHQAFVGCTGLTSMSIPASFTSIGSNLFSGCTNLASISVDNDNPNYSSEDGILYNKAKTTIITVPEGINGSVTIPESVTSIGEFTFYNCRNLVLAILPAGLTSIGNGAFYRCTNLALTELPAGLTSIGQGAFNGCTNLALTELPAGLTSIGDNAFQGCTNLSLTELPAGLTSIGSYAFERCTNLTLMELPAGLTSIGALAFYNCPSLALVICHAVTPPTLVSYAFSNHANLQIKVPAGSVEAYKSASGWSEYASRISAIE